MTRLSLRGREGRKAKVKLQDIEEIEVLTMKDRHGLRLYLDARMRNGGKFTLLSMGVVGRGKFHPERHLCTMVFPSESTWSKVLGKLKPQALTLTVTPQGSVSLRADWSKPE